ncbi:MAG: delta-60 repeat domain-containing protein [bacterium]
MMTKKILIISFSLCLFFLSSCSLFNNTSNSRAGTKYLSPQASCGDGYVNTPSSPCVCYTRAVLQSNGLCSCPSTYTLNAELKECIAPTFDTAFNAKTADVANDFVQSKGNDVAVQSDGKIVMVGSYKDKLAIWRFNADGSLDTSFAAGSAYTYSSTSAGNAVKILKKNSIEYIIAVGNIKAGTNEHMLIVVLDPSGKLLAQDVYANTSSSWSNAYGMIIRSTTSEIIVTGYRYEATTSNKTSLGVWVYNFNPNTLSKITVAGDITSPAAGGSLYGSSLAVKPSGAVVIVGAGSTPDGTLKGCEKMNIWELSVQNTVTKKLPVSPINIADCGTASWGVALDSEDTVTFNGKNGTDANTSSLAVWKMSSPTLYSIDQSFADNGSFLSDPGTGIKEEAYAIAVDKNDKIINVGKRTNADGTSNLLVIVTKKTGSIDANFNSSGQYVDSSSSFGLGLSRQNDDSLLVAGGTCSGQACVPDSVGIVNDPNGKFILLKLNPLVSQ